MARNNWRFTAGTGNKLEKYLVDTIEYADYKIWAIAVGPLGQLFERDSVKYALKRAFVRGVEIVVILDSHTCPGTYSLPIIIPSENLRICNSISTPHPLVLVADTGIRIAYLESPKLGKKVKARYIRNDFRAGKAFTERIFQAHLEKSVAWRLDKKTEVSNGNT